LLIDLILKKFGKDGIASLKRGAVFDHLLIPRSERSEEEKNKLKYKSIPFFCIAFVLLVLAVINVGFFPYDRVYFVYYAMLMFIAGNYVLGYRRSYYNRKGKILRNIADLLFFVLALCVFVPFYGYLDAHEYTMVFSLLSVITLILRGRMKKCEVIKPEDIDHNS
jgi:peptidoglycan/LPS O-acetylase OafA/YrhL